MPMGGRSAKWYSFNIYAVHGDIKVSGGQIQSSCTKIQVTVEVMDL